MNFLKRLGTLFFRDSKISSSGNQRSMIVCGIIDANKLNGGKDVIDGHKYTLCKCYCGHGLMIESDAGLAEPLQDGDPGGLTVNHIMTGTMWTVGE